MLEKNTRHRQDTKLHIRYVKFPSISNLMNKNIKKLMLNLFILSFSFWLLDTCTCSTPGAGTKNKNQFICSNDETRYCASDQECYATDAFVYGQWRDGCRIPGTIERSRSLSTIIFYDIHYTNHQLR